METHEGGIRASDEQVSRPPVILPTARVGAELSEEVGEEGIGCQHRRQESADRGLNVDLSGLNLRRGVSLISDLGWIFREISAFESV